MTSELQKKLNDSNYDFYFLVVDPYLDISIDDFPNFTSISPISLGITLTENNSGRLLSHPETIKFIQANSKKNNRTPVIIPFKPSSKVEKICKDHNWIFASNKTSINRFLEDKIKFVEFCSQNSLPMIPSIIGKYNLQNFKRAQDTFGNILVVQSHFGWAGNSSHLLNNYETINNIDENTIVKFSPMIKGYSLINNCCLINGEVIQSPPGLQYTGINPLTTNPLSTVGRQWPSFSPAIVQEKIRLITTRFASIINDLGYRGYFGLDFLVEGNNVYLLECNPRLTASFALFAKIETRANITPMFLFHLTSFISLNYKIDFKSETDRFYNQNIVGSEIVSKDQNGKTLKKYFELVPFSKTFDPVKIPLNILNKVK